MSELLKQAEEVLDDLDCAQKLGLAKDNEGMDEVKNIIKALAEELRGKEWQEVVEGKEPEGKVLICYGEPFWGTFTPEVEAAYFDEESGRWLFWLGSREVSTNGVTHWQPLPQPKQED